MKTYRRRPALFALYDVYDVYDVYDDMDAFNAHRLTAHFIVNAEERLASLLLECRRDVFGGPLGLK